MNTNDMDFLKWRMEEASPEDLALLDRVADFGELFEDTEAVKRITTAYHCVHIYSPYEKSRYKAAAPDSSKEKTHAQQS